MARITSSTPFNASAGAYEIDKNLATVAGYATLAGGVTLAGAIGTMVAPLPTLGLSALGGGLVVAGNFQEIKDRFSSSTESETPATEAQASA